MEVEEVGLLELRHVRAHRYEALLRLSLAALAAMGALLVYGVYHLAKTEIRRRSDAAEELARQKNVIEAQFVELRTAKDRLESVEGAKSALLGTASHELRTPLNHIIGFSSLLLEGMAGALNREQAKQVGMIRHSGNQLLGMVINMLDVASVEAGSISLNVGPVRLRPMVDELCKTHAAEAAAKGVSVHFGDCDPRLVVKADESRLCKILDNLLSNAVKFTPRGAVSVAVQVHGQKVRVAVTDGGAGIAPEQQLRLFEPFQRAADEISRIHPGLGLGLSVCRRLVRMMGGEMGCDSRLGEGSSFWFEIPLAYAPDVVVAAARTLRAV
jgi:signal transduction histidine kinase